MKFYRVKGRNFPKSTKRHAKTLLFSGFFAVLVSRETDAENQTVTRETYNFNCLKYPSRYRFCARFYSLIFVVLHLKSYVKNGFHTPFYHKLSIFGRQNSAQNRSPFHNTRHDFATSRIAQKAPHQQFHTPFRHISTTSNAVYCLFLSSLRLYPHSRIFQKLQNLSFATV